MKALLILLLSLSSQAGAAEIQQMALDVLLTKQQQKSLGLHKLTLSERTGLEQLIGQIYLFGVEEGKKSTSGLSVGRASSVIESQIDGVFEGWEGETVVKLMNGQIWQQVEYYYLYHYAYMPEVLVIESGGFHKMKVDGIDKVVSVSLLSPSDHLSNSGTGKPNYTVEAAANDEKFLINGEMFEAKTYCFSLEKGDEVIFLEGSALGVCVSAKLLDINSDQTCEVWCE